MKFLFIFLSAAAGLTQTLASTLSGRIYMGYEALDGMFPFQVLLDIRGADYIEACSGVLIGKSWILTAAHCVEDFEETITYVYLGHVFFVDDKTDRKVRPNSAHIHEDYDTLTLANDIALLNVDGITHTENIQPVKLPIIGTSKKMFSNHSALAIGWGTKGDNRPISQILRYTLVKVVSQKICQKIYADEFRKSELCVGTDLVGSPCIGDSGGPLLDVPSQVLIGILSSTYEGDCENGRPVIYTSITHHRLWIRKITGI